MGAFVYLGLFSKKANWNQINKLTSVFMVSAVIDHEFHHTIVNLAVDLLLWHETHSQKQDRRMNFFTIIIIASCHFAYSHLKIGQWACTNFCSRCKVSLCMQYWVKLNMLICCAISLTFPVNGYTKEETTPQGTNYWFNWKPNYLLNCCFPITINSVWV